MMLLAATIGGVSAAIAAVAAWVHWRRFHVPITVAAGAAAVAGIFLAIVIGIVQPDDNEAAQNLILGFILLLGIGMFLFAMWWDASDRARLTRRSDVAFWLHLLAAPMIAHPIFTLHGPEPTAPSAPAKRLGVVGLYILFGLTALAVDRRALLVSALAYVLYALTELFKQFGAVELNVALTALIIGSALLLLSAYLAPGTPPDRPPASVEPSGSASEPRPAGDHPTSRISRRSSGASTPARSWPRLSTAPCSPTSANAPCFNRSAGRFSMRTSGRSEWRRNAAKIATSGSIRSA